MLYKVFFLGQVGVGRGERFRGSLPIYLSIYLASYSITITITSAHSSLTTSPRGGNSRVVFWFLLFLLFFAGVGVLVLGAEIVNSFGVICAIQ